ncbi:MAG TPA: PQQ-binding-like beta-propeller repeat protein [Kiritimatiellia bacterium]|nr:PQQ-binding-like beta-propeller repeat protein [Kiritimatiellia bacterium]HOR97116.1 PQQ-binding-like beta-propeller repeat protein [Kiritimatiellia bacterium]HPK37018.1 PQQ-binding-like beta-propeller repeat protein [Kiritimatiellia bacterium]
MRIRQAIPFCVTCLAAVCAVGTLAAWLARESAVDASLRLATADGSGAEAAAITESDARGTDLTGCFRANREIPRGATTGNWPGFRGAGRDNVARRAGKLLTAWPETGPAVLWQIPVGDGHAMPALANGCLYLLDYDEARGGDCLRCLNADTGQERWEHLYAVKTKRNHGISRTVAATDGRSVVTIGPQGHVVCLDADDGTYRWGFSLSERYGSRVPLWYVGQCPLIDGDRVILAPAASGVLLCALALSDGKTVWETPNPHGYAMSHSSVMILETEGRRHYVYAGIGGIAGVGAEGAERGTLLWHTEAFRPSVVVPSPVPLPDGRFFMTAGYGSGGALFRVSRVSDGWRAETLFKTDRKTFASEQQTPVFLNGLLYTVLPSDGGGERQQLVCMTLEGQRMWASGRDHTFGLGPYVATPEGMLLLLNDAGTLTLARVGRDGFVPLARHALMEGRGRDAWGPMVLADNRLYLRDSKRLFCVQVGAP